VHVRSAIVAAIYLAALAALVLGACGKGGALLPPLDRPKPAPTAEVGPFAPVTEILAGSCALPYCHDRESQAGRLVLTSGQNHGNLVRVKSSQKPGEKLVVPGEPQHSYLLAKIRGEKGIRGSRMPIGRESLSVEQERVIDEWIAAGAKE